MRIADILKRQRELLKIDQKTIAKSIGKGLRAYQYYEEGRSIPKPTTLVALSKLLQFDLLEVYSDEQNAQYVQDETPPLVFKEEETVRYGKPNYRDMFEKAQAKNIQLLEQMVEQKEEYEKKLAANLNALLKKNLVIAAKVEGQLEETLNHLLIGDPARSSVLLSAHKRMLARLKEVGLKEGIDYDESK